VGAIWAVIHHHVTHGAVGRLPRIAPQLSFMALAPVLDAQEAVNAICAEPGPRARPAAQTGPGRLRASRMGAPAPVTTISSRPKRPAGADRSYSSRPCVVSHPCESFGWLAK
jgi:hypothetical protein